MRYLLRALLLPLLFWLAGPSTVAAQGGRWVWARQAGGAGADTGKGIATDAGGHVYVAGEYVGSATFGAQTIVQAGTNGFLAKYDSAGTVLWAQSIANSGRCSVADVAADPAGNTYLIGSFVGTATFGVTSFTSSQTDSLLADGFIVKLDPQGVVQWAKHLRGSPLSRVQNVVPICITALATGEVAVGGAFERTITLDSTQLTAQAASVSAFMFWLAPNGSVAYHTTYQSPGVSVIGDVLFDKRGYLFITGFADSNGQLVSSNGPTVGILCFSPTVVTAIVALYFPNGHMVFENNSLLYPGLMVPQGLATDGAGDCYLTGYFSQQASFAPLPATPLSTSPSSGSEAFLVKLRRNQGLFLWERQSHSVGFSEGMELAADSAGQTYISGAFGGSMTFDSVTTLTAPDTINTYLASFDKLGNPLWAVAGGKTTRYEPVLLAMDRQRHLYITGQFRGSTRIGSTVLPGQGMRPEVFLARFDGARPLALPAPVPVRGPLVVYPNPVSSATADRLHIVLPVKGWSGQSVRVRLLNPLGQLVAAEEYQPGSRSATTEVSLPVEGLAPGLYTLLLDDAARRWAQPLTVE